VSARLRELTTIALLVAGSAAAAGEGEGGRATGETAPPTVERPAAPPEAVAAWLARQLSSVRWDAPYGEGDATTADRCEAYRSDSYVQTADRQWCRRCRIEQGTASIETFFYAFDLAQPLACRLHQVRARATAGDRRELHAALVRRLDADLGPSHVPEDYHDLGSAGWRDVRRWQAGPVEVLVYVAADRHGRAVWIRARHRRLRDAAARRDELYWQRSGLWTSSLERRLAERLGSEHPGLARQLAQESSGDWQEPSARVLALLDAAADAPTEERAALMLAADRLADRLDVGEYESPAWDTRRSQLEERGLGFSWVGLGMTWAYGHELLRQVSQELPDTDWGEWAFLMLLDRGWDTSPFCESSDRFRLVVEQGERFLSERPRSPQRRRVLLSVAEAYETWFSLSRAAPDDEYANASSYEAGSERARLAAIARYEELLRLAPGSPEAAYARWALPRLKLDVATAGRRYFCIYD
jgi:hypothetical protein